jgi:hypothetical protein
MPRAGISLFRRIERALETIAPGSIPLKTIHTAADFLADNFADEFSAASPPADDQTLVVVKRRAPELEEIPA